MQTHSFLRFVALILFMNVSGIMQSQSVKVQITPDTISVLKNPLTGWVIYLGRTWDEDFWEKQGYDSMDIVPKSEGNTDSWYTSETELTMAANEFYILGYWQEPLSSSEQWSDNTTYRLVNRNSGSNGTVLDGTLNGQQYEVYALWQQSYKLIARANTMLENIHKAQGKVTETTYNRFAGEAYFARACKYADLIFFYGDVPYMDRTETITEAEQQGRMD